jgi:hypothetical protein
MKLQLIQNERSTQVSYILRLWSDLELLPIPATRNMGVSQIHSLILHTNNLTVIVLLLVRARKYV